MGVVGAIGQRRMRRAGILRNAQNLPSIDIVMSDGSVVGCIVRVVGRVANDGHGFDSDDTFQGQVGLVPIPNVSIACHAGPHHGTYAKLPAKSSVEIWLAG